MGCGVSITAVAEASRRPASPDPWQKAESTSCPADLGTVKTFSSKNATRGAGDRERGRSVLRETAGMKKQNGHIINVLSVYVHKVGHAAAVYCATKFAMHALSDGLRQEAKPYHIRTIVISPDAIATELAEHIREPEIAESIRERVGGMVEWWNCDTCRLLRMVAFAISQPKDVDVNEILFRPAKQAE